MNLMLDPIDVREARVTTATLIPTRMRATRSVCRKLTDSIKYLPGTLSTYNQHNDILCDAVTHIVLANALPATLFSLTNGSLRSLTRLPYAIVNVNDVA